MNDNAIKLSHGNGAVENNQLIKNIFYDAFSNETLSKSEDAAIIEEGKLAFTTDSFTINPIFFKGGDIGKLSICGTCNDLAMMGAKPKYLSCSFILEEGFCMDDLKSIVNSMKKEISINGAQIVCGDTKVVPKGSADKIFINITGIGEVIKSGISLANINQEDIILVSRDIGTHGASILSLREGMEFSTTLQSDCQSLYPIVKELIEQDINITALRDATRGGLASVLNEWAEASNICIEIDEAKIPICDEVRGFCEILGFDPLSLANEGTFILAVKKKDEQKALDILKKHNPFASRIGMVSNKYLKKIILNSPWGTQKYLDMPSGELLPRIC